MVKTEKHPVARRAVPDMMRAERLARDEARAAFRPVAFTAVGPDGSIHFHGVGAAAAWLEVSGGKLRALLVNVLAMPHNYANEAPDALVNRAARNFPALFPRTPGPAALAAAAARTRLDAPDEPLSPAEAAAARA